MPETFHENFDTRDTNGQFVLVICSFVGSLSPNTAMLAGTCQVAGHWSHGVVALQDAHSARQADALVCRQFASTSCKTPKGNIYDITFCLSICSSRVYIDRVIIFVILSLGPRGVGFPACRG